MTLLILTTTHPSQNLFIFQKTDNFVSLLCDLGQAETLSHTLLHCPGLQAQRSTAVQATREKLSHSIYLSTKWKKVLAATDHTTTQFLLDPTSHNLVPEMRVCMKDKSDDCLMFYVTRLWCYSIDRARWTTLRSKGVLR